MIIELLTIVALQQPANLSACIQPRAVEVRYQCSISIGMQSAYHTGSYQMTRSSSGVWYGWNQYEQVGENWFLIQSFAEEVGCTSLKLSSLEVGLTPSNQEFGIGSGSGRSSKMRYNESAFIRASSSGAVLPSGQTIPGRNVECSVSLINR